VLFFSERDGRDGRDGDFGSGPTPQKTVTTDTHRHASLEILFRMILRPAWVRLLS